MGFSSPTAKKINKMIKVVVFDCDGVLFNTIEANRQFYNQILKHFKKPLLKEKDMEMVTMMTVDESLNYLFRDDPRIEEAKIFRKEIDYRPFFKYIFPEPNLLNLLDKLKGKVYLAVCTNRSNTIIPLLKSKDIYNYFDMVVSSLDVKNPKPDSEPIQLIMSHFSIQPNELLFIGDSTIDEETAKNSGVVFVAYKNKSLTASYHIDDLLKVIDILQKEEMK